MTLSSTYRLQFHAGFTFSDATRLVRYLHDLGISHVYTSPYLRARSGSTHGYDVADPNALNPELGGQADYDALVAELRRFGMGQLVDVVPNHMGIGDPGNYRWRDVLENGPASIYAHFFDINWREGKLVVPTLGDQYGKVLENGELRVEYQVLRQAQVFPQAQNERFDFVIAYYEHHFPVAPDAYPLILQTCHERLQTELGPRHEHAQELASVLTALHHLPPRQLLDAPAMEERNREKEIVKRRLRALHAASAPFRGALESVLLELNGRPGEPDSFDQLNALLDAQSYRLAFWRVAAEEINYRRFFDITELAAVRMEDPLVFQDTHRLLLRLIGEGKIQGLRIDHPDGLRDPARYFRQLRESMDYVVIEKILLGDESLRAEWPVAGTTGYDFLNLVNGVFVARDNARFFDTIYFRFLRQGSQRFKDLANSTKKMVMLISLASEVNELAYLLKHIASSDRRHRDFTLNSLTFVIREVIAALDVYRTYIDPTTGEVSDEDRAAIERAVLDAKRRNPRTDPSVFDFVGETLLQPDDEERLSFVARFQQTTGPVMAKGAEDTAFYVHNRLISLNDVGGDPDIFGRSLTAFHRGNLERAQRWPTSMLATSTHDTKRSEDVRARINVLSELPRDWRAALTRWSRLNGRKKVVVAGRAAPDRNEEYLLYQTLLGAWPFDGIDDEFRRRIDEFMLKALREAKVHTSWISQNDEYEEAVRHFVRAILDTSAPNPFIDDFLVLQRKVGFFGTLNSIAQTVLKLTSPGVADIYQGNELWDFSLVDPDNRRPVDFVVRQRNLRSLVARASDPLGLARQLFAQREDGRIKLYVSHRLLCLRREQPGLFVGPSYLALRSMGRQQSKRHVCAFARTSEAATLVVAVPVLMATLMRGTPAAPVGAEVWRDDWLPVPGEAGRAFRDLFTGQELKSELIEGRPAVRLRDVFGELSVGALLAN